MGGTCGTDCQSLKLSNNINMDSDVRRNRANSKQSAFKTKNVDINKLSLQSPSHSNSAETPTMASLPSPQHDHELPTNLSINNWVHQVLTSTSPIPDDTNDYNIYNHTHEPIQVVDNEDLFRSALMNKMDDEDLILTELYENGEININTKPNLFRPNTPSVWDDSDIDDLEDEMKKELQAMQKSSIELSVSYNNTNHNQYDHEYIMDTNNEILKGFNLIKTWCDPNDWDSEDMELEEDEMKKHLNHLKLKYESSTSN